MRGVGSDLFTGVTEDGVFSSVLASAGLKHGSIFQEVSKHIDVHFSSRATRRDSSLYSRLPCVWT